MAAGRRARRLHTDQAMPHLARSLKGPSTRAPDAVPHRERLGSTCLKRSPPRGWLRWLTKGTSGATRWRCPRRTRRTTERPRVPRPDVVAIRVPDAAEKEMLLASDSEKFFTEPHYNGFPAVLVRLGAIEVDELEELIIDAWRCQAPRTLVKEFEAS